MKSSILFCFLALSLATSVLARGSVVKSCSTSMSIPGEDLTFQTDVFISQSGSSLIAKVKQKNDGIENSYADKVSIEEHSVRENLDSSLLMSDEIDKINLAERVIVHAMALSEGAVFEESFSAGLDLKKVRSAKLFIIGEQTEMGLSVIVEAKDARGNVMGSFMGGFLVSPCK